MRNRLSLALLVWIILHWRCSYGEQVVYLDRGLVVARDGGSIMKEPVFSPSEINASIGEQVHFVARFQDQSQYGVLHSLSATDG